MERGALIGSRALYVLCVSLACTFLVACGSGGGASDNGIEVPEYEVVSDDEYPLEDGSGPVSAKTLIVQTSATSEEELQRIAKDIGDTSFSAQDALGLTLFRSIDDSEEERDFVVVVRNERAARALGLNGEEFIDGGIVVNPEIPDQTQQAEAPTQPGETPPAATQEQQEPEPPKTPEDKLRANIAGQFQYREQDLRRVAVQNGQSGCKQDDATLIESDMANIYTATYGDEQVGDKVCGVTTTAYGTLTDNYGQQTEEEIYSTTMNANKASRVNWEEQYMVEFPTVWKVNFVHPAVQAELDQEAAKQVLDCAQQAEGLFDFDSFECP